MRINPEDYLTDIKKAARQVAADYGGRFEADDIAQAIIIDMMTNPTRYNKIGGSLFFEILKRAGKRFCVEESAHFLVFASQHTYSTEEIKKLLPDYYTTEVWPNGLSQPILDDFESVEEFQDELEEWNNATQLVIDMMDLEFAIEKISQAQRKVVEKKYRDRQKLESKYERNKHSEAVRFIAYHVNSRATARIKGMNHEGPGARKALSNSRSIAITANHSEQDGSVGSDVVVKDAAASLEWYQRRNHPINRPSKHVVNSPWRKIEK